MQYHGLMPQHFAIDYEGQPEEVPETGEEGYQSAEEPSESLTRKALRGAANIAANHVYPAVRDIVAPAVGDMAASSLKGAAWLLGKSVWTAADVLFALNGETQEPQETPDALEAEPGVTAAAALSNGSSEDYSQKPKGFLVEEIYKRPRWAEFMGRTDSKGYHKADTGEFRKKLLKLSNKEPAEVLKHLYG